MKPSHKIISAAIGVVCMAIVTVILIRKGTNAKQPAAGEVSVGRYFDWNASDGFGKDQIRPMIAERLVEKSHAGDFYVSRLAKEVKFENNEATIVLREAVYWSDQTQLVAEQVVDAFRRRIRHESAFSDPTEQKTNALLKGLSVAAVSKDTLKIEGLSSEQAMYDVITTYAFSPIRKDLIEKDGDQAWRISLGAYTPWAIQEIFKDDETLRLVVNPYYYRGAKHDDLVLTPSKFPRNTAQTAGGS